MRGRTRDGDHHLQQRLPCDAVRGRSLPRSGNQTGKFTFDPDDPTLGNTTGSFTNGFNDNGNSNVFNSTSNFSARGRTEDGEMLRFHVTSHITIVGSDVIVQFDNLSCG